MIVRLLTVPCMIVVMGPMIFRMLMGVVVFFPLVGMRMAVLVAVLMGMLVAMFMAVRFSFVGVGVLVLMGVFMLVLMVMFVIAFHGGTSFCFSIVVADWATSQWPGSFSQAKKSREYRINTTKFRPSWPN
jgi:hypothetical protein